MMTRSAVDPAELATLKALASAGAMDSEIHLTCRSLADDLSISTQTASRRLQSLEAATQLERTVSGEGQWIELTERGRQTLNREYEAYRDLFENDRQISLVGTVIHGMGEGRHYISLPGYMEQFVERLEYEPFAGTLNIDLTEPSIRRRGGLERIDPIEIEGWEGEERSYGPAYCYPATVGLEGGPTYEPAHVIAPERTHHDEDQLEVIAPEKLRDVLGLEDGQEVIVDVAAK